MTFIRATNDWLSALLKILGILLAVAAVFYLGLSIWGNVAEARAALQPPPDPSKATYEFHTITGQIFLAKDYQTVSEGKYVLNGYYYFKGNKWVYNKGELPLDGKYWGEIEIKRRLPNG